MYVLSLLPLLIACTYMLIRTLPCIHMYIQLPFCVLIDVRECRSTCVYLCAPPHSSKKRCMYVRIHVCGLVFGYHCMF